MTQAKSLGFDWHKVIGDWSCFKPRGFGAKGKSRRPTQSFCSHCQKDLSKPFYLTRGMIGWPSPTCFKGPCFVVCEYCLDYSEAFGDLPPIHTRPPADEWIGSGSGKPTQDEQMNPKKSGTPEFWKRVEHQVKLPEE